MEQTPSALKRLASLAFPPLIKPCAYLNTIDFKQVADQVQISRFEDMITDPLGLATRIAREAGMDVESHQVDLQNWAQRVQNTNTKAFEEAKTSRPYSINDHRIKIGRWKENLSVEKVTQLVPIFAFAMERMGYQVED